jgi:4-amino-4-deoxy-L-arabinose transferase-like glycosyltransferase
MIDGRAGERSSLLKAALAVGALAFTLRLIYFLIVRHGGLTDPDSTDYISLATALTKGHYTVAGLSQGGFPVDLNRPPIYPAFLVAANLGGHISAQPVALVQVFLGAIFAGALTYVVGRWLGLWTGVIAGIMLAIDWITVINSPLVLSDLLFAMLYAAGFALVAVSVQRGGMWAGVAGGLVLGAAALVKPIGLAAVLPIVLVVLISPKRNWRVAASIVGIALVTVPWAIRNDNRYGVFTISTVGTVNLYAYNAHGVLSSGYLFGTGAATATNVADQETAPLRRLGLTTSQLYSRMNSDAVRTLTHHLPKAVVQELWGALHVLFGTGKETLINSTGDGNIPSPISSWLPLLQTLIMWALALVGVVVAWTRRTMDRGVLVLLASAVVFVVLAAGGPAGYGRYRLPAAPFECVFAAVGLVALTNLRLVPRRREAASTTS